MRGLSAARTPPKQAVALVYPTLVQLLGGSFRQDRVLEGVRTDDILAEMVREASTDQLRAALRELDALLGRGLCEPQLSDVVLYEIGCHIAPEHEGLDTSAWLVKVRESIHLRIRATGE